MMGLKTHSYKIFKGKVEDFPNFKEAASKFYSVEQQEMGDIGLTGLDEVILVSGDVFVSAPPPIFPHVYLLMNIHTWNFDSEKKIYLFHHSFNEVELLILIYLIKLTTCA